MAYPYFLDHNESPTIVIMKESIEEEGSVARQWDCEQIQYDHFVLRSKRFYQTFVNVRKVSCALYPLCSRYYFLLTNSKHSFPY